MKTQRSSSAGITLSLQHSSRLTLLSTPCSQWNPAPHRNSTSQTGETSSVARQSSIPPSAARHARVSPGPPLLSRGTQPFTRHADANIACTKRELVQYLGCSIRQGPQPTDPQLRFAALVPSSQLHAPRSFRAANASIAPSGATARTTDSRSVPSADTFADCLDDTRCTPGPRSRHFAAASSKLPVLFRNITHDPLPSTSLTSLYTIHRPLEVAGQLTNTQAAAPGLLL
jgi:hypothetical protein